MAKKQPAPAPVEAGQVETEQRVDGAEPDAPSIAQIPLADTAEAKTTLPNEVELTGRDMAEIRARSEATDRAQKDAEAARASFVQASRLAQYSQEALTVLIREMVQVKGLDPAYRYRVDIDQGRIVPVGLMQAPTVPTG